MNKRVISTIMAFALVCGTITPIQAEASTGKNTERKEVAAQTIIGTSTATTTIAGSAETGAEAKVTKEEAKAISIKVLKDFMGIEVDEKTFQSSIQYMQDYGMTTRYLWMIGWNTYSSDKNINANVSIDASTAKIVSINSYEYSNNQKPKGVTKTQKEAKKIADAFIKKINPEEYKQMEYIDDSLLYKMYGSYKDTNYNFRYIRKVNGIPYENNYISAGVDGTTGKINNYNYYWDEAANFPALDGLIGTEKALDIYKKATFLKLYYTSVRDPKDMGGKVTASKLVYQPDYTNFSLVNAKDGGLMDWQGTVPEEIMKKDLSSSEKAELLKSVQPSKKLETELDNEGASALGKTYIQELFGTGYDIQNLNYSDGGNNWYEGRGKSVWTIQFSKQSPTQMMNNGGNLTIESKTGMLVSAYTYNGFDEATLKENFVPSVSWVQAYDKAIDIIKKQYPDKLDKVITEQIKTESRSYYNGKDISNRSYSFSFPRVVNGISYIDNNINITIDAATGKATQMNCMWDEDMMFTGLEKVITPEAAAKIYFDNFKPTLSYISINRPDGKASQGILLAYLLKNNSLSAIPSNIDAETGVLLGYTGLPLTPDKNSFASVIKGNKYERELTILAFQGIIDENNFSMNKAIKKADFLKMLVNTRGQIYIGTGTGDLSLKFTNIEKTNEYYNILQQAVSMGLIENKAVKFDLKGALSREEMAEMLVKFIQLDKVAKAKGIFKLSYTDAKKISKARFGSVAICKGLGVFENSKQFRPLDKATALEAALAIYNTLNIIK